MQKRPHSRIFSNPSVLGVETALPWSTIGYFPSSLSLHARIAFEEYSDDS